MHVSKYMGLADQAAQVMVALLQKPIGLESPFTIPTGKDTCAFFCFRTWIMNSMHIHGVGLKIDPKCDKEGLFKKQFDPFCGFTEK